MLKEETYLLRHRISQRIKRVRDSAHSRTALSLTTYSILPVFLFNFGSVSAAPQIVSNPDYKPSLIQPIALIKPLKPVAIPPAPPPIQPPVVPSPAPPPAPVAPAPVTSGSVDCGSNPYMVVIYQKESGCRSWAVNPGGCQGLGQECGHENDAAYPYTCSLYDWTCQDNWFQSYAVRAYGSIYNAYLYRIGHNSW